MNTVDLPLELLEEAPWNANTMSETMLEHLRESIRRYGLVQPLVVRRKKGNYEVLAGNQRLKVLQEMGFETVTCITLDLDDVNARVLAQALNRIQGEDDISVKAGIIKEILQTIPQSEVLAILPETAASLNSLSSLGSGNMDSYLRNWELVRSARLKHLQFQLTPSQLQVVELALRKAAPHLSACKEAGLNSRSAAISLICRKFLEQEATQDE